MISNNVKEFQESITKELDVVKNRVRNLIGDANWGEEGRYKEGVLKNIIRKFLPNNVSVGTGFILKTSGDNHNNNNVSKQLDIIIYDNTLPVLFSEGDFVITTLSNVRGIIEVKSKITDSKFQTVINQFDNSVENFISEIENTNTKIFLGVFAFEFSGDIDSNNIDSALKTSKKIVNHISLGKNCFIRKWKKEDKEYLSGEIECDDDFYNIYKINDLSFSYFISNLIDIACGELRDRYWFLFPIEGTKEVHRVKAICLNENNC